MAGHKPQTLRPGAGWPPFLKERVIVDVETVDGGLECDLRSITPLDLQQVRDAAERLVSMGAESLAIVGVFSPILSEQEEFAGQTVSELFGKDFPVSLSSNIGGIGFIERENATILNSALKQPMQEGFSCLHEMMWKLGVKASLFLTQNNGSVIDLKRAIEYPLLTVSSGPTNSFIGACKLAGVSDAIVIDVGGTSTDIGCVQNGFPRRSIHNVSFGGVSLNFRTPDVLALPIGGGSMISGSQVGPESCGGKLKEKAQVLGGDQLTLTDIACRAGVMEIDDADLSRVALSPFEAEQVLAKVQKKIQQGVNKMRSNRYHLPMIAVGGGADIVDGEKPEYQAVANAYGAALAEISATVDTVLSLVDREKALEDIKDEVLQLAVDGGGHPLLP